MTSPRATIVDRGIRHLVGRRLDAISDGAIALADADGTRTFGVPGRLRARIEVHDARTYRAIALGGTIGAAEAFARGWWSADDLTTLVRIMARNRAVANGLEGWSTWLARLRHLTTFRLQGNRRDQSRRNISAHYDLGNEFFAAFLDPTMTYSCAVFPEPACSLEDASRHKLDGICRQLDLGPHDTVLEIGTGWGSLAVHAARHYGCRVVTTTISRAQYDHARTRVRDAGLADRVTLLTADYRDLPRLVDRQFDKVVSVEMIEAVGYAYLDRYFHVCDAMTRPGGTMLLQAIVIADAFFDAYRRSVDVIQRHIFPGGFLPSLSDLRYRIAARTGFEVAHLRDITAHYPGTLRRWREGLHANRARLRALGYPSALLRMWDYYFCYCEGGFLERTIGTVQLVLTRSRAKSRA